MIDRFNPFDWAAIAGGIVMALGTFLPIVHFPIAGTMNYLANGRGDGMIVLALAAAILILVCFGLRRIASLVGFLAAGVMLSTVLRLAEVLNSVQLQAKQLAVNNPFGQLASMFAKGIGLEWGWVVLFGGAFVVVAAGLMAPRSPDIAEGLPAGSAHAENSPLIDADQAVARYVAQSAQANVRSPRNYSEPQFGKRRTGIP